MIGAALISVRWRRVCVASGGLGLWRALNHASPFIDIRRFRRLSFSIGCAFSFVLGFGLYGSIYLLALFLGLVRGHTPLVIGEIMVVTGISRLLMAPVAALLEVRVNARLLTAFGFGLFGIGVFINGQPDDRFSPACSSAGAAVASAAMLCSLLATWLALDGWPDEDIADASGLFNLMRNLGGAIGIARDHIDIGTAHPVQRHRPGGCEGRPAIPSRHGSPGLPVALFRPP